MVKEIGGDAAVNILSMIAITEKYIKGYRLKWNSYTKRVQLLTVDGQVINYFGIKEEDVYTVFKLFALILEKGIHNSIFYINALNYTTPVLQALLALIYIAYGEKALVFLYNCHFLKREIIKTEVIELPNYLLRGKR